MSDKKVIKAKLVSRSYLNATFILAILLVIISFSWYAQYNTINNKSFAQLSCTDNRVDELNSELSDIKHNYNDENVDFCYDTISEGYEETIYNLHNSLDKCRDKSENFDDIERALYYCEDDIERFEDIGDFFELRRMQEKIEVITEIYGDDVAVTDVRFGDTMYKCIED